jgi:OHCU decarboxylase
LEDRHFSWDNVNAENQFGRVILKMTLSQLNQLKESDFVHVVGPAFEHSPWIAVKTFTRRPFTDLEHMLGALRETVKHSDMESQLALIRAHPDLAGSDALAGRLTGQSRDEQAGAGLDNLSPKEIERFQTNNLAYREKFGFPFVICARRSKKAAILEGFDARLGNSREREIETALEEIFKIAELRLREVISS